MMIFYLKVLKKPYLAIYQNLKLKYNYTNLLMKFYLLKYTKIKLLSHHLMRVVFILIQQSSKYKYDALREDIQQILYMPFIFRIE